MYDVSNLVRVQLPGEISLMPAPPSSLPVKKYSEKGEDQQK